MVYFKLHGKFTFTSEGKEKNHKVTDQTQLRRLQKYSFSLQMTEA